MTAFVRAPGILWRRFTAFWLRPVDVTPGNLLSSGGGKLSAGSIARTTPSFHLRATVIAHDRCQQIHVGFWTNAIAVETRPAATSPMRSRP